MNRTFWITLAIVSALSVVCGIGAGSWTRGALETRPREDSKRLDVPAPSGGRSASDPAHESGPRQEPADRPRVEDEAPTEVAVSKEPSVTIPDSFDVEDISEECWRRLAGAITRSGDADAETRSRLESSRTELQGKLPTENPNGKGELTHPIVVVRVVASLLEEAGLALGAGQWKRILTDLERYEKALGELRAAYTEDTLRLERILDEIELKQRFLDGLSSVLDDRQGEEIAANAPAGEPWPEFLSPLYMADTHSRPMPSDGDPVEQAKFEDLMTAEIARESGIDPAIARRLAAQFFRDVKPLLDPGRSLSKLDRALIAGRAHARLFSEVLRNPGVPERLRRRVLNLREWAIPGPAD